MNYLIPYLFYGEIMENCWCKHEAKGKNQWKGAFVIFCGLDILTYIHTTARMWHIKEGLLRIVYSRRKAHVGWQSRIGASYKHWICSFAVINFNSSILLIQMNLSGRKSFVQHNLRHLERDFVFWSMLRFMRHKFQLVNNTRELKISEVADKAWRSGKAEQSLY